MIKNLILKIITFLLKKKIQTATGEITQVSKTKIFMVIEALLQAVEFVSPHFGNPIAIPTEIHQLLWSLAGLSYAERSLK